MNSVSENEELNEEKFINIIESTNIEKIITNLPINFEHTTKSMVITENNDQNHEEVINYLLTGNASEELRKTFNSNLNEDWGCGGGGYSFIIESLTRDEYLKLDCSNLTSLLIRNNWKKKFEGKFDYSIYKWEKLYILITGFPNSIG